MKVLAFDIYGTLVDTGGVAAELAEYIGADQAAAFAAQWRRTQLEYSFRRGLMRAYADFKVCTRQALLHTRAVMNAPLSEAQCESLMARYAELPFFADAAPALQDLAGRGDLRLFAFSNGAAADVRAVLAANQALDYFADIVSVDEVRSFKPDPAVYGRFLARAESAAAETWLISANPFDVIGARHCRWNAAWVRRDPAVVFDPWDIQPTATIAGLGELTSLFSGD